MEEFASFEHVVAQKKEGKWKMLRGLAIGGYVLFALAYFTIVALILHLPMLCFGIPVFTWMVVYFTWPYVSVEYSYHINSGTLVFSKIYGGRKKKKVMEVKLKDMTVIAPLSDPTYKAQLDAFAPEVTYSALSGTDAPDVYFGIYTQDGKRCVFYFEATQKTLKICRYYNSTHTVMSDVRI